MQGRSEFDNVAEKVSGLFLGQFCFSSFTKKQIMPANKYNQFKKAPTLKQKIRSFKRILRKKVYKNNNNHF